MSAKPAIGYCRVSTEGQVKGVSLEAQLERITSYCAHQQHPLMEVCTDKGISGKKARNRPALQKALSLVCQHKGVLVVYSLSRMARNVRDCLDIAERLQKCGADLASVTENLDTASPMGKCVYTILAAIDQMERDRTSERTRDVAAHCRERNQRTGKMPYGYDLLPDLNGRERRYKLTPNTEYPVLQRIIQSRASGHGYRRIANALNADGIPAKHGGKWVHTSVVSALHRHSLMGAKL